MFSLNKKLSTALRSTFTDQVLLSKDFKSFRVLIKVNSLQQTIENKINSYHGTLLYSLPSIQCIVARLGKNAIQRLTEYPQVDFISIDGRAILCGKNVASANGVYMKPADTITGKGVCVGIIDTGVYPHPDLLRPQNRIMGFLDLVNSCHYPYDDHGHGTCTTGIICGSGALSKGVYRGIAPGSSVYMIKAFDGSGRGYISDILYGLQHLSSEAPSYNIKFICLPFETLTFDPFTMHLFYTIFEKLQQQGILCVVPAGHNGNVENSMTGIATLKNCLTIGGIDSAEDAKPYCYTSGGFSGKIAKPELSAACNKIFTLNTNINYLSERDGRKVYPSSLENPYTVFSGTSAAAAYICGVCALMVQKNNDLNVADIISLLKIACKILPLPTYLQGNGLLDLNSLLSKI